MRDEQKKPESENQRTYNKTRPTNINAIIEKQKLFSRREDDEKPVLESKRIRLVMIFPQD